MTDRTFTSHSEEETREAGATIAAELPRGAVVTLEGPLGAGKTVLARAISTALGCDPLQVSSPSFALVHEYDSSAGPIVHVDGYRLSESGREWEELGIEELAEGARAVLIEWPRTESLRLAGPRMAISIEIEDDGSRTIRMSEA